MDSPIWWALLGLLGFILWFALALALGIIIGKTARYRDLWKPESEHEWIGKDGTEY